MACLDSDVGVTGAFGAQIAHGCETGHERRFGVIRRAADAQGERFLEDLIVQLASL